MLKGAVIGIGKIALECHLPAFRDKIFENRAKIVAAVDINLVSLENAEKLYPGIKYYSAINELLKNEQLDFIDICTPPAYHYNTLKEAINEKLNIISEKPFTLDLLQAEQITRFLQDSHLLFTICHQYRYSPIWQHFRKFIIEMDESDSAFLQFNILRTEADKGLKVLNNVWRINPEISGGGILSDTGVHYLYLCLWMLGLPISVTARTFNLQHKDYAIEDTAVVILEYKNAVAEINLTWAAGNRANSARLVSRRGSMVYDGKSLTRYVGTSAEELTVPDASDKSNYIALYISLFDNFVTALENGIGENEMLYEAMQSVKLLELCYKSACDNKTMGFNAK